MVKCLLFDSLKKKIFKLKYVGLNCSCLLVVARVQHNSYLDDNLQLVQLTIHILYSTIMENMTRVLDQFNRLVEEYKGLYDPSTGFASVFPQPNCPNNLLSYVDVKRMHENNLLFYIFHMLTHFLSLL